eukprot:SM000031S11511  [mRNA]  locus=s31:23870:28925:- [translate_table: standard]
MEELVALLPEAARAAAAAAGTSPAATVVGAARAVEAALTATPRFRELLEDCGGPAAKDGCEAAHLRVKGNALFTAGRFREAAAAYSEALRREPVKASSGRHDAASLYANRAACFQKLEQHEDAERDCNRALALDGSNSNAWFRRGCAKAVLGRHTAAIVDLEAAQRLEAEAGRHAAAAAVARQIAAMGLWKSEDPAITSAGTAGNVAEAAAAASPTSLPPPPPLPAWKVAWSEARGRDLIAERDLQPGDVLLEEDAYAAVLQKSERFRRCYACATSLPPAAGIPCAGCALPLFCSDACELLAGGLHPQSATVPEDGLLQDAASRSLACAPGWHAPECSGASWAAVVPIEAVLAARLFWRGQLSDAVAGEPIVGRLTADEQGLQGSLALRCTPAEQVQGLRHHLVALPAAEKVRMFILGTVLSHCLAASNRTSELRGDATSTRAAKLAVLLAVLRDNAMAVKQTMAPPDNGGTGERLADRHVEKVSEVNIAQALYPTASLLNHSCAPNVAVSFTGLRLTVRAVEFVGSGSRLELCYGPQKGEMTRQQRRAWLKERYFFCCHCSACSDDSTSGMDLALSGFRCCTPACNGIVTSQLSGDVGQCDCPSETRPESTLLMEKKAEDDARDTERKGGGTASAAGCQDNNIGAASTDIGRCTQCGETQDISACSRAAGEAFEELQSLRLEAEHNGKQAGNAFLRQGENALTAMRRLLHPFNRRLAEAEDVFAATLCFLGMPAAAERHARASLAILKVHYPPGSVVLAHECAKVAGLAERNGKIAVAKGEASMADRIWQAHHGQPYPYSVASST